jgi:protein TonB
MLTAVVLAALLSHVPPTFAPAEQAAQPSAASPAQPEKPWPPAGVERPGNGVNSPRLLDDVKPGYVADAMRAGVQGVVRLEAVVRTDGTVGEVRVTRSLDRWFGQDDECVRTVKKWRFKPGTKDGVAVPVVVEVEMTFTKR